MGLFGGHKLIKDADGYVLFLYIDFNTEFAGPFGNISKEGAANLRKQVEQYIETNLPNLKIKLTYIVVGSLLVASFSFVSTKIAIKAESESYLNELQTGEDVNRITDKIQQPVEDSTAANHNSNSNVMDIDDLIPPIGGEQVGELGKEADKIQKDLVLLGYNLPVDGTYNLQTTEIIARFMEKYPEFTNNQINESQIRDQLEILLKSTYHIISDPNDSLVLVNKLNSLSHDYIPNDLVTPNILFSFTEDSPKKKMRKEAAQALEELFNQAEQEQILLLGASGYRSYDQQAQIFARNYVRSGAEANQFSARPGESEHQTGLAMDVTCAAVNNQLTQSFGDTLEGQWLINNASEFGFIIRYPKGGEKITGYQYEPWHIRYVGKSAAKQITENGWTLEQYTKGG